MLSAEVGVTSSCTTQLRRVVGRLSDELAIHCHPTSGSGDPAAQSEAVYRELLTTLAAEGASMREVTRETLLVRDLRRDLPLILAAREHVGNQLGVTDTPLPIVIQQPPIARTLSFELIASAVLPHDRAGVSVHDLANSSTCGCAGCRQSGGRLVSVDGDATLYTGQIYGAGGNAEEQVQHMFGNAESLLAQCGMQFRDVLRTWIYLRHIDRDYEVLNRVRKAFFQSCGIELRPASTAVAGGPLGDHDIAINLVAARTRTPLQLAPMSSATLNEAWSYGAEFSRGLRIAARDHVTLQISGTASIDERGRTVHVGDCRAQAGRMLDNIAALLAGQGAAFDDLVSGVVYIRDPADAPTVQSVCRERGFDAFPCTFVEATMCRPELLCEAEVVARGSR